jgi:hypothetical protein
MLGVMSASKVRAIQRRSRRPWVTSTAEAGGVDGAGNAVRDAAGDADGVSSAVPIGEEVRSGEGRGEAPTDGGIDPIGDLTPDEPQLATTTTESAMARSGPGFNRFASSTGARRDAGRDRGMDASSQGLVTEWSADPTGVLPQA